MSQNKPTAHKSKIRKSALVAEEVALAIGKYNGNLAAVARHLNVDRHTVKAFIDQRPTLQQALLNTREGFLDEAESSLYQAVKQRKPWAVCFVLKTLGKSRGYIERQQVESIDGTKLEIVEEIVVARTKTQEADSPSVDPAVADAN